MKKFAKHLILLSLAVAMAIPFSACSKEESSKEVSGDSEVTTEGEQTEEKVTLRIYTPYSNEDETIPYDYAVEEIAKVYPNVELELDIQSQDDGQKLSTYAATGNLPDIFQVNSSQITAFTESNNILMLDEYIESLGYKDKLYESASNLFLNEDGHTYAFPYLGNNVVMMYYNKDLFEQYDIKVPETYDELKEAVIKFNENDIVPLSIFAKEKWITTALYDIFATRLAPEGIVALNELNASASDDAYRIAAENIEELVGLGLVADGCTNMNYDQASALFYSGKAAMFINGPWEITASSDELGDSVDWMTYPVYEGYEDAKYAFSGSGSVGGVAVSPYSEHEELAVEVAALFAEKYAEGKYIYRNTVLLPFKSFEELTPEREFSPMAVKLNENVGNITSTTSFAWGLSNLEFKVVIEDQTQFLLTPGYTAEEFVTEVDKIIEEQKSNK